MNPFENLTVAKGGNYVMSNPAHFAEVLEHDVNQADVVVVSAPGPDPENGFDQRMTDALIGYASRPDDERSASIQARMATVAHKLDSYERNPEITRILESIPSDLREWHSIGAPVPALGEYWTAKLFAAATGRTFVDARYVVRLNEAGQIDANLTYTSAREVLMPGQQYVIPGFYGSDPTGKTRLLGRNASDETGAILASVLYAKHYDIWSNVPGFMTADPRLVPNARLVSHITYRELREAAINGSQVVHSNAARHLFYGKVVMRLRDIDGEPDAIGTIVTETRDYEATPIVCVTGDEALTALTVHKFGLDDGAGRTVELYDLLKKRGTPYRHVTSAVDYLGFILRERHVADMRYGRYIDLARHGYNANDLPVKQLTFVGEGLARGGFVRSQLLGRLSMAFEANGINEVADSGPALVPALNRFVESNDSLSLSELVRVGHSAAFGS